MELSDHVAIVTGAGQGIGKAAALALAGRVNRRKSNGAARTAFRCAAPTSPRTSRR